MFHSGPTWGTKDEERMGKLLYNCFKEAVNIFCRPPEWIRNVQMIPGFSTRLGWEHGWKSCMANSKDWRSENVNMIELNCKAVKKVATPHFYINPPFLGLSPLSSKNRRTPLKWLNFWKVLSPFNKGEGGSNDDSSLFSPHVSLVKSASALILNHVEMELVYIGSPRGSS